MFKKNIYKQDDMTLDLIGERGDKGHPHDSGSAPSPRNDTSMTLPLRQVDTILKKHLTNQHATIKYVHDPMKL
jgi:hypothetical protein